MAKLSRKTIEPLLTELAEIELKSIAIGLRRDNALQPHKDAYEKKAEPIVVDAKEKLEPLAARRKVLTSEIERQLLAGVDEKTEKVALSQVVVDIETNKIVAAAVARTNKAEGKPLRTSEDGKPLVSALAEVVVKEGDREVDAKAFFESVEESKRDSAFWGCLKVGIAPVVKFLGAGIDKLATRPKKWVVSISLKS